MRFIEMPHKQPQQIEGFFDWIGKGIKTVGNVLDDIRGEQKPNDPVPTPTGGQVRLPAPGIPQNGATGEPQNTLLGGSMLIPLVLIGAFILLRK